MKEKWIISVILTYQLVSAVYTTLLFTMERIYIGNGPVVSFCERKSFPFPW